MKIIKYRIRTLANEGTDDAPQMKEMFSNVMLSWNPENEEIAKAEAYHGEYTIEDDGTVQQATQLDIIEAQVAYTAMMTDTLLEV